MMTAIIIITAIVLFVGILLSFAWYRLVPPSEAHLVVTGTNKKLVCSPDKNTQKNGGKSSYFEVPSFIPVFGRKVRKMDVTIKELVIAQETYEKGQARYKVKSSTKYRITDVEQASETFIDDESLKRMMIEVIQAGVRAVTVKYDVQDARAKKQEMATAVKTEISDDLKSWGLTLVSFQLVDFQDTETSSIVSDISKRKEIEIKSQTRQENAEREKQASVKEHESNEVSEKRRIKKDEEIAMSEQNKAQKVAEQQKIAEEIRFEVIKVQQIKQAEIDKEKAIIKANENKETEFIKKEMKRLEGEGDRAMLEEQAKGNAAEIREQGLAEALALEEKQKALNKFGPAAIQALIAKDVVEKDKAIGIEGAKALQHAQLKLFSGTDGGGSFDVGKNIEAMKVSSSDTAKSTLYNLARGLDIGFTNLKDNLPELTEDEKVRTIIKEIEKKPEVELSHKEKEALIKHRIKNDPSFGKVYDDIKGLNLGSALKDFKDIGVNDAIKKLVSKFKTGGNKNE